MRGAEQGEGAALGGDGGEVAGLGVERADAEGAEGESLLLSNPPSAADVDAEGGVVGGVEGDDGAFDLHLRAALVEPLDERLRRVAARPAGR